MLLLATIAALLSYFVGSIPFGLIITRVAGHGDVRNIGSGNIGATNVLRTGKKSLAILTLLRDAGKGALAVWFIGNEMGGGVFILISAVSVVMGHMFPLWLKGKGGKGVATALAVFAVVIWPLAIVACAIWLATFLLSRISSLASLLAMVSVMISVWFTGHDQLIVTINVIALAVIIRHKENIARLLKGEEAAFKKS